MSHQITIEKVKQLRQALQLSHAEKVAALLDEFSKTKIEQCKVMLAYHDTLLFGLAYPKNENLFFVCAKELERLASISSAWKKQNAKQKQLLNSGIAHTELIVSFSFDIVKWLVETYPSEVAYYSCDAAGEKVKEVLQVILPKAEQEVFESGDYTSEEWIKRFFGSDERKKLQAIINCFGSAFKNENRARDVVFDSLELFVLWSMDQKSPSRTFARSPKAKIFYHNALQKEVDAVKELLQPLRKPLKISATEKQQVLNASRGALCMLQRETDPLTYADAEAIELHRMSRGVDIALFPMGSALRMFPESYIGYMAFKNGLPIAYGGGWIFLHRAKIGINIMEAFRGGESSFLFAQILRLYKQRFSLKKFIAEPYQFGRKNPEGLQSGAFWFYYHMGFQPQRNDLKELAAKEFSKIISDKSYRSPVEVLKQFTQSNLEWIIEPDEFDADPSLISSAITNHVITYYNSDRNKATESAFRKMKDALNLKSMKKYSDAEQYWLKEFSLLLSFFPEIEKWKRKKKQKLVQLIREKASGSEILTVELMQQHTLLKKLLLKFGEIKK